MNLFRKENTLVHKKVVILLLLFPSVGCCWKRIFCLEMCWRFWQWVLCTWSDILPVLNVWEWLR